MQITVSGKNIDVSTSLRDHVIDKLNSKIGRFDTVVTANVTLSTDRSRHIAEITLFGKGFEMRAEEHDSYDMYRSINTVVEKLEKQLGKARSKNIEAGRREREEQNEAAFIPVEDDSPIKHIETYAAEPMNVENAIKILEDKNYMFYAFNNVDNGRINVVYVLENGGYALVDPRV
ncbi:ribosome-associated translation inhibitor RaiA [bacterium]|nr:ribosome-associated translation inhibitor RaiA [bacterium]